MTAAEKSASVAKRVRQVWLAGFSILFTAGLISQPAQAHTKSVRHRVTQRHVTTHHYTASHRPTSKITRHVAGVSHYTSDIHYASYSHGHLRYVRYYRHGHLHYAVAHYRYHYSTLQCVPYAREVSHIDLSGDAFLWWAEASGRYARGTTPAEGAVLNFRAIPRMPLGHVAVVTSVVDSRTVIVTQANWIPGTITNDVTIEDVSDNNDWSEVQVELGDGSKMGSPYPTYGFIYNQPDNGTIIANNGTAGTAAQGNEFAEAPTPLPIAADAPDRNLQ